LYFKEYKVLCFRCGNNNPDGSSSCLNCGQKFSDKKSTSGPSKIELPKKSKAPVPNGLIAPNSQISDRYNITNIIGTGPLGTVYRALDIEIDVDVAVKVFNPKLLQLKETRFQFMDFIHSVKHINHENVVRIYDEDLHDNSALFTMQLLEGLSLRKIIKLRKEKDQSFSAQELEPIFSHLCQAIDKIHEVTIHGNIKPENVIVLPEMLKTTDFGLIKAIPSEQFLKAQSQLNDTKCYLAPELQDGAIEPTADIYSLGVLLFEMLTYEKYESEKSIASQIPDSIERWIPLLEKSLDKDPESRHSNAHEFFDELHEIVLEAPKSKAPAKRVTKRKVRPKPHPPTPSPPLKPPVDISSAKPNISFGLDEPEETTEEKIIPPMERVAKPVGDEDEEEIQEIDEEIEHKLSDQITSVAPPDQIAEPTPAVLPSTPAPNSAGPYSQASFPPGYSQISTVGTSRVPLYTFLSVAILAIGIITFFIVDYLRTQTALAEAEIAKRTASPNDSIYTIVPPAKTEKVVVAKKPDEDKKSAVFPVSKEDKEEKIKPDQNRPLVDAAGNFVNKKGLSKKEQDQKSLLLAKKFEEAAKIASKKKPAVEEVPDPHSTPTKRPLVTKKSSCPKGMVLIPAGNAYIGSSTNDPMRNFGEITLHKEKIDSFCIDRYEYPNLAGRKPMANVSWKKAASICKSKGKRLCSESEWEYTCKGSNNLRFPYGNSFNAQSCNTEDANSNDRIIVNSGSFPSCRSPFGVFDLSGNVSEWTASSYSKGASDRTYKGGSATRPNWATRCASRSSQQPNAKKKDLGFRCCAD
jgi:serine/threonine protein kinase/formylglycine-generating enzyme required for sulfatase activity